jgi:hypothetical protein
VVQHESARGVRKIGRAEADMTIPRALHSSRMGGDGRAVGAPIIWKVAHKSSILMVVLVACRLLMRKGSEGSSSGIAYTYIFQKSLRYEVCTNNVLCS